MKHLAQEDVKGCGWGVAFHPEQFTIGLSGGGGGGLFFWKPGEKDGISQVQVAQHGSRHVAGPRSTDDCHTRPTPTAICVLIKMAPSPPGAHSP
ncbi:MAG: hypothetical protein R3C99_01510 [Pirellulaceae bacterium]